jgi:ribosome-binding protein aMBF1 (putative translation factor)
LKDSKTESEKRIESQTRDYQEQIQRDRTTHAADLEDLRAKLKSAEAEVNDVGTALIKKNSELAKKGEELILMTRERDSLNAKGDYKTYIFKCITSANYILNCSE